MYIIESDLTSTTRMYVQSKVTFLLILVNQVLSELDLTILHTNDVHARVDQMSKYAARCSASDASENKCFGGVARMKTEVDRIRRENQNVLLLDGGDQFQGTSWFVFYNGDEAAHFMGRLGYDAMVRIQTSRQYRPKYPILLI